MLVDFGSETLSLVECPHCGVTVLEQSRPATGFLAPCGRRLMNLSQCGEPRNCPPASTSSQTE